jgi:protein gp37
MATNSSIEWTHHTFNPWWGCVKVSPGCKHCYAETLSNRFGNNVWGPASTTTRKTFGDKHWSEPIKWNEQAAKEGTRKRVFCASMADVFEDHPIANQERGDLLILIRMTPHIDWLLLTKRPENICQMIPTAWYENPLPNVWYGTSVENQEYADKRIPYLLGVPAAVRFLSCEPLLGGVILQGDGEYDNPTAMRNRSYLRGVMSDARIHWVIAGGESGRSVRSMHPDWARSLRDQCVAADVPFHFKQWGGVNKKAAGRVLDGRTWDQFPGDANG